MILWLLLSIGCAECSGGGRSLIGHRSLHAAVDDAKHMAMAVGDVDPDDWRPDPDRPGCLYVADASGSWEILSIRMEVES